MLAQNSAVSVGRRLSRCLVFDDDECPSSSSPGFDVGVYRPHGPRFATWTIARDVRLSRGELEALKNVVVMDCLCKPDGHGDAPLFFQYSASAFVRNVVLKIARAPKHDRVRFPEFYACRYQIAWNDAAAAADDSAATSAAAAAVASAERIFSESPFMFTVSRLPASVRDFSRIVERRKPERLLRLLRQRCVIRALADGICSDDIAARWLELAVRSWPRAPADDRIASIEIGLVADALMSYVRARPPTEPLRFYEEDPEASRKRLAKTLLGFAKPNFVDAFRQFSLVTDLPQNSDTFRVVGLATTESGILDDEFRRSVHSTLTRLINE